MLDRARELIEELEVEVANIKESYGDLEELAFLRAEYKVMEESYEEMEQELTDIRKEFILTESFANEIEEKYLRLSEEFHSLKNFVNNLQEQNNKDIFKDI